MEVIRDLHHFPASTHPVIALGNFDGVHLGHRAILKAALDHARAAGRKAFALTFEPSPAKVLAPKRAPLMLMTAEDKLQCIEQIGLDGVVVISFTLELSRLSPRDFVSRYLIERLGVAKVVVGHSVTFGHKRAGNAEVMARLGAELGFAVTVIGPVAVDGEEVSSSRIRELVASGDMGGAARLLGRYHFLRGMVIKGRQRGRDLGFPTANLNSATECIPPDGVYATRLVLEDGAFPSISNIGMRPTFSERERSIEAHVFDFNRDLYGQTVKLELIERLRPELKFENSEALARQMKTDVRRAREVLAGI